jgi:hypothetical protein
MNFGALYININNVRKQDSMGFQHLLVLVLIGKRGEGGVKI